MDSAEISFEHLIKLRDACISNAEDLLNSAKALIDTGALQVSYHLAVLALEEMGKLGLMEVKYNLDRVAKEREFEPDIDDHIKKLFWAFFSIHLSGHKIDVNEFNSLRGIASQMHKNRLDFLYVNVGNPVNPRSKLTLEQLKQVIGLAESRIGFEKAQKVKEPTAELDENAQWFVMAFEDPDKRSSILNEESYAKLTELQSFRKWIEWNRRRYEDNQKELRNLLDEELAKTPLDEIDNAEVEDSRRLRE